MALTLEKIERLIIALLVIGSALALGHCLAPYYSALLMLSYAVGILIVIAAVIAFAFFGRK